MAARILQLNCGRALSAMCELGEELLERRCSFALIQEPCSAHGGIRGLPANMRVFADMRRHAAVVVNDSDVECTVVSCTDFGVCVRVEGVFGQLFLASIYCKFSEALEPYLAYMDTLLLLANSSPLVLGIDGNASSPLWFSKTPSSSAGSQSLIRGEMLSEWLISGRLHTLNEPSELYTFDNSRGVSDIDLTIANEAALRTFQFSWQVSPSVSDHNFIEIVVDCERTVSSLDILRWRTRNVDWNVYGEHILNEFRNVPVDVFRRWTADEQIAFINESVQRVNDNLLQRCRKKTLRRLRWWTRELTLKRREVRRLRKRFQRAKRTDAGDLDEHRSAYRSCLAVYKKMLIDVKEDDWRQFVACHRDDPWGHIYRICSGRKDRCTDISGLRDGNVILTSWSDCVKALLREFFPREEVATPPPSEAEAVTPPLERTEIAESVALVRARKSPGMDGITGEMCKSVWKVVPEYLEALYGRCVHEGYFPREWKAARVIVLLKSVDKDRSNPRSYRGISLLPVFGKILERILVQRLRERVGDTMCRWQFGFVKGQSVEDAWAHVKTVVASSAQKYVLGLFIDFKGAFDYLCWSRVIERLGELGCQEIALWRSYFSERRAVVIGAIGSERVEVVRGCPQGSICGPFVWNLMMDTLLHELAAVCNICAYADDLLIMIEGKSRSELEQLSSVAMGIVTRWSQRVGVDVSVDKTVVMMLKGRFASHKPTVRLGSSTLKYCTEVKYLGITMGEGMNFLPHIGRLRDKLTSVVGKIRRVLRSEWGLSRRAVRIIYSGLFVAIATYGSSVWCDTARSVFGQRRLFSCQRIMLLACMPVCRTVSTDALQVLMGAAPLDLEVMRRCIDFKAKRGYAFLESDWLVGEVDGLSRSERRARLDAFVTSEWQARWDSSSNGRVTYRFIPDVDFVKGNPGFSFDLSLGFVLTGHGSLNAFLHRMRLADRESCDCGAPVEDWLHVLCDCPLYGEFRDLESMGISMSGTEYIVDQVVRTVDSLSAVQEYSKRVFASRRSRVV